MAKSEVYSWRMEPELKMALEEEARKDGVSLSVLLDQIAEEWLMERVEGGDAHDSQEAIRERVRAVVGTFRSGDPHFSQNVSQKVGEMLRKELEAKRKREAERRKAQGAD
ncbi:MAG TPA: hypothetical protein VLV83_25815 [Acidobacteriota bacterium]|nr:hypothetical protein [Acidobacteriota bacterium]